jgi:hypothetical protein
MVIHYYIQSLISHRGCLFKVDHFAMPVTLVPVTLVPVTLVSVTLVPVTLVPVRLVPVTLVLFLKV